MKNLPVKLKSWLKFNPPQSTNKLYEIALRLRELSFQSTNHVCIGESPSQIKGEGLRWEGMKSLSA